MPCCSPCCIKACCFCRKDTPFNQDDRIHQVPNWSDEIDASMTKDTVFLWQVVEAIKLAVLTSALEGEHELSVNIPSPSRNKGVVCVMKSYDSSLFSQVRQKAGINNASFERSWNYSPTAIPQPKGGAGRSGSLFLLSKDRKYIIKTLPHHEVSTLRAILPAYLEYLNSNPSSRLMRFYALLRIRRKNSFMYVVVANNIFYSPTGLRVVTKYDLKGREPKKTSLARPERLSIAKEGIWKDNQLGMKKFYPDHALELIQCLSKDATFLASQQCIDYSLLIGVHDPVRALKQQEEEAARLSRSVESEGKRGTNRSGHGRGKSSEGIARGADSLDLDDMEVGGMEEEEQPWFRRRDFSRNYSFSVTDKVMGVGIPSTNTEKDEVYFIGIIDFLSRYFMKKKTAHFFKSFLWDDRSLSTVPPVYYCFRFNAYLPTIIAGESTKTTNELEQSLKGPRVYRRSSLSVSRLSQLSQIDDTAGHRPVSRKPSISGKQDDDSQSHRPSSDLLVERGRLFQKVKGDGGSKEENSAVADGNARIETTQNHGDDLNNLLERPGLSSSEDDHDEVDDGEGMEM